jgi:hypothetical protein
MTLDKNTEVTILKSYQSLPPNHRVYLWMLVFITLWSQVIIIVGGWLRKRVKRENKQLQEQVTALEQNIALSKPQDVAHSGQIALPS